MHRYVHMYRFSMPTNQQQQSSSSERKIKRQQRRRGAKADNINKHLSVLIFLIV